MTSDGILSWGNIVFNQIICTIFPSNIILPKHQEDFVLIREAHFKIHMEE